MPRFSERISGVKIEIQLESMNDALRNSIWNFTRELIRIELRLSQVQRITSTVLRLPVDVVGGPDPRTWLLGMCLKQLDWAGWYDLLEYAVENAFLLSDKVTPVEARAAANTLLEREHSGYRFIAGTLAPITASAEIAEIEQATRAASIFGLDGAREHITQALNLFGKRPDPDYRNAVKEAISAVEGVVKMIDGTRAGGLHDALAAVSARIDLHPALKAGLEKLYGYTSDEDGVRHPILEEATVDEVDARFMIVTCSAFVSFLISKADAAGLLKKPPR